MWRSVDFLYVASLDNTVTKQRKHVYYAYVYVNTQEKNDKCYEENDLDLYCTLFWLFLTLMGEYNWEL